MYINEIPFNRLLKQYPDNILVNKASVLGTAFHWYATERKYKKRKGFFSEYYNGRKKVDDEFWEVIFQIAVDNNIDFPEYVGYNKELKYVENNGYKDLFI